MLLNRLLNRFITKSQTDPYQVTLSRCESPIEREFLKAAWAHLSVYGRLDSQAAVGPYRVDFLLSEVKAALRVQMVIEIDGQDYHSSPEQRDRDTERDRWLARNGYQVVRFTGRQVRRGAAGCAREAVVLLQEYIRWLK